MTKKVMEAKNINIDEISPKDLTKVDLPGLDLVINMSGRRLPTRLPVETREWKIEDPIGKPEEFYLVVRDQIEMQVMHLVLELRREVKRAELAEVGTVESEPRTPSKRRVK